MLTRDRRNEIGFSRRGSQAGSAEGPHSSGVPHPSRVFCGQGGIPQTRVGHGFGRANIHDRREERHSPRIAELKSLNQTTLRRLSLHFGDRRGRLILPTFFGDKGLYAFVSGHPVQPPSIGQGKRIGVVPKELP